MSKSRIIILSIICILHLLAMKHVLIGFTTMPFSQTLLTLQTSVERSLLLTSIKILILKYKNTPKILKSSEYMLGAVMQEELGDF